MLSERDGVAVWVFAPRDTGSIGRLPDPARILLKIRIAFKVHAGGGELGDS